MIEKSEIDLQKYTHDCDRIRFEISSAENRMRSDQNLYEQSLAKLNESDAAMAGLAEQIAAAGQSVRSSSAEVDRFVRSINELRDALKADESELAIAQNEFGKSEEPHEPDLTSLENLRANVATSRAVEVEARLGLRTLEERVAAIAQRASDLENAARNERESASKYIARREARARGAITAQSIADAAYEALIQIESS
ncbi:MAG: recombination protein RecF, partial [Actinobacteria bacterium]|nr:recombination protein RecF [Actinomycetota bacterium]